MAPATFSYGMAGKASIPCNAVVTRYSQLYFNRSLTTRASGVTGGSFISYIELEFYRSYLLLRSFLTLTGYNSVTFYPALIFNYDNALDHT